MVAPIPTKIFRLGISLLLLLPILASSQNTGYVKKYNGSSDWVEVAGKNSFGNTSDGGTITLSKISGNQEYKSYIIRRKSPSSTSTFLGFRQDSSANSKSIAIIIQNDSIKIQKRATKGGIAIILYKAPAPIGNFWIKAVRNNSAFSAYYSTDGPNVTTPTYTLIQNIVDGCSGWATSYWKGLGVASNSSTISTAEFTGFNGGTIISPLDTLKLTNLNVSANTIACNVNNCATSSVTYTIKQGTTTALTGTATVVYNAINISHTLAGGNYTIAVSSTHCANSVTTNIVVPSGTVACNCGFAVVSAIQTNATTGQFVFSSCNISALTWRLKPSINSSTILASSTISVTQSTVSFGIPSGLASGTYYIEASATNCIGTAGKEFTYTVGTGSPTAWVEHPGGLKIYNADGSIASTPLIASLSGTNSNILTVISTTNCPTGYTLSSSIDGGNFNYPSHNYGWVPGVPSTGVTIIPDGRVHTITTACVGDIWGSGSNAGIINVNLEHFRVGGSVASTITPESGISYLNYDSNFSPIGTSRIPQFYYQLPTFTLPNKQNSTSIGVPKTFETFDLRNRGFKYFDFTTSATTAAFPASVQYKLDPDNWANPKSVNTMNNATQAQAESWALSFVGGVRGKIDSDDEYRGSGTFTTQGLQNAYYFFKKAKETGVASVVAHQTAPYKTPSAWYQGTLSLSDLAKPLLNTYTTSQLISEIVPLSHQSVYWLPVSGLPNADDNAGKYLDIDVSAYTSEYNSQGSIYRIAWELFINKKYFPTKKVCAKIEGFDEVSVYGSRFGSMVDSWTFAGGAAAVYNQPVWNPAKFETVATLSNFLGDGITIWESTGALQESNPAVYYVNNSLHGTPAGYTNVTLANQIGVYPNRNMIGIDYAVAGLERFSRIPTDIDQSNTFQFEISTDGGTTWITGNSLHPLQLEKDKKPLAYGMKNTAGTKFAVWACFPLNTPESQITFKIRGNGLNAKSVTLNGQFPELLIITQ